MIDDLWHPLGSGEQECRQIWKTDRGVVPSVRHEDIVAPVLIAEIENVKVLEEDIQNAWPEETVHVEDWSTIPSPSRDWVQGIVEKGGGGVVSRGPGRVLKSKPMLSSEWIVETGGGEVVSRGPGRLSKSKPGQWEKIEACCTNFALQAAAAASAASISTDTTIPTFDTLKNKEIS